MIALNKELNKQVNLLQEDFRQVTGEEFKHFYCPILFDDVQAELCQGHIFNRRFAATDRSWTVQRKVVDSFFGAFFESDFITLDLKGKHTPIEALADLNLRRQLRPKIAVDGSEVQFYGSSGLVPAEHTRVTVSGDGLEVPLIVKLSESDILASPEGKWEIGVERDLRVPALASMIKSAHLTMFRLMGYRYALSAAGHFVGMQILGSFFRQYAGKPKEEVLHGAYEHFAQYQNMARPILSAPEEMQATVTSREMYLCRKPAWPWAMLVYLRTGSAMHGVLLPIFENDHAVAHYLSFLNVPARELTAYFVKLHNDHWEVSKTPQIFDWPESKF